MAISQAALELLITMKDEASSGLSSLGGALKTVGGIAGGVALAGVAAFGAAVVSGIGDARGHLQEMAQTEAVIKSTGGAAGFTAQQIEAMSDALGSASGKSLFDAGDIQKGNNLLLTFTNIKETLPEASQVMVDMAQAMGTDVAGGAIQLGKALNDPITGISALSRVGVTFTDQQKKQIKTMQEAGDMAGAQGIILAELNKEFGGSAQAAADADGGWAQITARWGEAKEALGAAVLPLLNGLAGLLNDRVLPAVEAGAAAFSNLIAAFQTGAEGGDFLGGLVNALYSLDSVSPVFDTIGDDMTRVLSIWDDAQAASSSLAESIGYLIDTFMGVQDETVGPLQALGASLMATFTDSANPIEGFLNVLSQVSPTFDLLRGIVEAALPPIQDIVLSVFGIITGFIQEHGATMLADVTQVWNSIQALINAVLPPIQAIVGAIFGAIATFLHAHGDDIKAFLGQTWDAIASIIKIALALIQATIVPALQFVASFITEHGDTIQRILGNVWDTIKAIITAALAIIKGVLTVALDLIKGDWSGAWEAMKTMLSTVWDSIVTVLSAAWDTIVALFGGFATQALGLGRSILDGIVDGAKKAIGGFIDTVVGAARDALNAAKKAVGFGSPAKMWKPLGGSMIEGIGEGFMSGANDLYASISGILDDALQVAQAKLQEFKSLADFGINLGASTVAEAFQGGGALLPHFAGGGFAPGGPIWVGEQGPEILTPPRGSRITPNNQVGGQTLIFNIDARGATMTQQQFEASVRKVLDGSGSSALSRIRTGG